MPTLSKKEMNSRLSALRELDSGALRMAQHHDQQLADLESKCHSLELRKRYLRRIQSVLHNSMHDDHLVRSLITDIKSEMDCHENVSPLIQYAQYMHCTCQEKGRDPNVMPKQTAVDIKDDAYGLHKQLVLQLTDIQNHVQELQMELDDINRFMDEMFLMASQLQK
ncbi:hypothetical protein BASA61_000931 [Batrachochytrium salamandrivorans]|nr:hypothetical protein BASA61_000931 [Batrachochytrium salamandrivorans]